MGNSCLILKELEKTQQNYIKVAKGGCLAWGLGCDSLSCLTDLDLSLKLEDFGTSVLLRLVFFEDVKV